MKVETVKSLIRHSILTSLALDAVGVAFESGYSCEEKYRWCEGPRTTFPNVGGEIVSIGVGSFNSEFFCVLLLALFEHSPVEVSDMNDFMGDLSLILDRYATTASSDVFENRYLSYLQGRNSDGLLIPVSAAIAYYCAANFVHEFTFFNFCDRLFTIFDVSKEEYEAALFFSFVIYRLCFTGYFGFSTIEDSLFYSIGTGKFKQVMQLFMDNHLDHHFLNDFQKDWSHNLNYFHQAIVNVVFFMLRVDTAYPKDLLKSLPREQVSLVFNVKAIKESDMGFLFGAICTASEHKHPLIPKPLRECVSAKSIVDSALQYV